MWQFVIVMVIRPQNVAVLLPSHCFHQPYSQTQVASAFNKNCSDKPQSTTFWAHQTAARKKGSVYLATIGEHLAAKEPDVTPKKIESIKVYHKGVNKPLSHQFLD